MTKIPYDGLFFFIKFTEKREIQARKQAFSKKNLNGTQQPKKVLLMKLLIRTTKTNKQLTHGL